MRSNRFLASSCRAIPGPIGVSALFVLAIALCSQGCSESEEPARHVHTSFSEATGLQVYDSAGLSQQLIRESLGVRAIVSPSGRWIAVEDMQLSNLVGVRAFEYTDGNYREVTGLGIRQQWEALAEAAGVEMEELIRPHVGIEAFGPGEDTIFLRFKADTGMSGHPEIDAVVEIPLESHPD